MGGLSSGKEWRLTAAYSAVSLTGFVIDYVLMQVWVAAGLEPAWARAGSLLVAMQATFLLNGLVVFRRLTWRTLPKQWVTYMATNGLGNLCNYWIFVTLVSTHWPVISDRLFAMCVGAFTAWLINYLSARLLVFRQSRREPRHHEPLCRPDAPGSAPR